MPPSLQDLSAAKVLQSLRKDADAVQTYTDLPQDVQQILFPHLWQDYLRLLEVERKYDERKEKTPAADRYITFYHLNEDLESDTEKETAPDLEENDNGDVDMADGNMLHDAAGEESSLHSEQTSDDEDVNDENNGNRGDEAGKANTIAPTTPYTFRDYFRSQWRHWTPEDVHICTCNRQDKVTGTRAS